MSRGENITGVRGDSPLSGVLMRELARSVVRGEISSEAAFKVRAKLHDAFGAHPEWREVPCVRALMDGFLKVDEVAALVHRAARFEYTEAQTPLRNRASDTQGAVVGVMEDMRGRETMLELNASFRMRTIELSGDRMIERDDRGFYRFIDPASHEVVAVRPHAERDRDTGAPEPASYAGAMLPPQKFPAQHLRYVALLGSVLPDELNLTFVPEVRVTRAEHLGFSPSGIYCGYAMPARPRGAWVSFEELFGTPSALGADPEVFYTWPTLDPEVARVAGAAARRLFCRLQDRGIIIDPLRGFKIDLASGAVALDPSAHIMLTDVRCVRAAIDAAKSSFSEPTLGAWDPAHSDYVPNIFVRALAHDELAHAVCALDGPSQREGHPFYFEQDEEATDVQLERVFRRWSPARASHYLCEVTEEYLPPETHMRVMAAWYDHVFGVLDRHLQRAAHIESRRTTEATLDRVMHLVRAHADARAFPTMLMRVTVDNEGEEVSAYDYEQQNMMRRIACDLQDCRRFYDVPRGASVLRGALQTYIMQHGMDELPFFAAMMLPMIVRHHDQDPERVAAHAGFVATQLSLTSDLRWGNYSALASQLPMMSAPQKIIK